MSEFITVARPYAKAAFDFAVEHQSVERWQDMLAFAAEVTKNEQMAAMYSRSIFRFSMTVSSLFQLKRSSVGKLMFFRRHRQIDDRQNHEDEGLQRNDQDVENGPRHIQDPL